MSSASKPMSEPPKVAAVLLAAGTGSRFRAENPDVASKLTAVSNGEPIVRRVAKSALASSARPLIVVTGFARSAIMEALGDVDAEFVFNPLFATGLASSLIAGLARVPNDCDGALILLGDMPRVTPADLDRLIAAFAAHRDCPAVVPTSRGVRGNPVLLSRALFEAASRSTGDQGARRLLDAAGPAVVNCEVGPNVVFDVDAPSDLEGA
jgi:molybdenum cofactor cytidylyltransferase